MTRLNTRTVRYGGFYLLISISSNISSSLINSSSEYRFPHPLLSTIIHLFLALLLLTLSNLALQLYRSPQSTQKPRGPTHPLSDTKQALRNPYLLAASLSATPATLLQMHQSLTCTPNLTIFTKHFPLLIASIGSLVVGRNWREALTGLASWTVLIGREGVDASGSKGEWACAVGWSVGVIGWAGLLRKVMRESASANSGIQPDITRREGSRSRNSTFLPFLQSHLILSLLFFLPALLLSSELPRALKYHHLSSYSTELGFWLQEIGVSACGLLNLFGFYKILQVCDSINEVLLWVSIKNYLLPYAFAWILGNPLDNPLTSSQHARLSPTKQAVLLLVLGAVRFAGPGGKRGKERKEDLDECGCGIRDGADEGVEAKYMRDEEKGRKAI